MGEDFDSIFPKLCYIIIDNNEKCINGDFEPTRFGAAKIAAKRYSQFLFKRSLETKVGVISTARNNNGLKMHLVNSQSKFENILEGIEIQRDVNLTNSIKRSILGLRYNTSYVLLAKVLVIIGSKNNVDEYAADQIIHMANNRCVGIDIVAFGPDVDNIENLERITKSLQTHSHFIRVNNNNVLLSDSILSSPIGPVRYKKYGREAIEDDQDLDDVIKMSLEYYSDYDEDPHKGDDEFEQNSTSAIDDDDINSINHSPSVNSSGFSVGSTKGSNGDVVNSSASNMFQVRRGDVPYDIYADDCDDLDNQNSASNERYDPFKIKTDFDTRLKSDSPKFKVRGPVTSSSPRNTGFRRRVVSKGDDSDSEKSE